MGTARYLLGLSVLVAGVLVPGAASAATPAVPPDCAVPPEVDLTQFHVRVGTNRSEVLRGTAGPDFICGRLGSDVIFAGGGDQI